MTSLNQDMAQKFHKFRVFIKKTLNLWNFSTFLKPCLDLMMSFKNCIRIELQVFGALPTSSDDCDVDRLLWAGLQALGGIDSAQCLAKLFTILDYLSFFLSKFFDNCL